MDPLRISIFNQSWEKHSKKHIKSAITSENISDGFMLCCQWGTLKLAKLIMRHKSADLNEFLEFALVNFQKKVVKLLIKQGAKPTIYHNMPNGIYEIFILENGFKKLYKLRGLSKKNISKRILIKDLKFELKSYINY
jgi:hypothetical protein